MTTDEKIAIIDQIVSRHPGSGVEKGWSEYTGGMKDSGHWYYRKMLDAPGEELKAFLEELITDENKPAIPLTPEEEKDSKIILTTTFGAFVSKLEMDRYKKFMEKRELEMYKDFLKPKHP